MKWYSANKREHVEVQDMNLFHARAALAKLERGDYLDESGEPLGPKDHITMRSLLERRVRSLEAETQDQEF